MNMMKSTLAAAVATIVGLGVVSEAAAYVYAGSKIDISTLTVDLFDLNGVLVQPGDPRTTVNSFSFGVSGNSLLQGSADSDSLICGGIPGSPPGPNTCNAASPRLGATAGANPANAVNSPNSSLFRPTGSYAFLGPTGADDFANANAEITTATLTFDATTTTAQISETELNNKTSASSSTNVDSTTGFTFTIVGGGVSDLDKIEIRFLADPDALVEIAGANAAPSALATIGMTISLTENVAGGAQLSWSPKGTAVNDCTINGTVGTLACVETADSEDLNINIATAVDPSSVPYSLDGVNLLPYGIDITGLSGFGTSSWTFALAPTTSTLVLQQAPTPGTLALLGGGLALLGVGRRRRQRAA